MQHSIIVVVLVVGHACAQLNFEGNPLTENTEYTAEESQFSAEAVKKHALDRNLVAQSSTNVPQKLYPMFVEKTTPPANRTVQLIRSSAFENNVLPRDFSQKSSYDESSNDQNVVQLQNAAAELALNTFLNSKTPEESRLSLDYYLKSTQSQSDNDQHETSHSVSQQTLQNKQVQMIQSPPTNVQPQVQSQPLLQSVYPNIHWNPLGVQATPIMPDQRVLQRTAFLPTSPMIQARNDIMPPPWRSHGRWVRGKPHPFVQPKLGPGFPKGPPVPFAPNEPVEVIYTKPPGYHRALNPPHHHSPSANDIYYSQLYAQSYDPYYYDYIAKTGKIKPQLYGKLGKYHHEQDDSGIWSDLYKGFTKHGLKNIMTPTFLLGMTLPMLTFMLMALIQKRSFARSELRNFPEKEDPLREYVEKLRKAMECYERKRRKSENGTLVDSC